MSSSSAGQGYRWPILALQAVCFALFALWTSTAGLTLSGVLLGLTIWGGPPIVAVICGDMVEPVAAPAAYGFPTAFHALGQAAGPYVAGRMADTFHSFTGAYLLAPGVAVLGAVGMMLLHLLRARDTRPTVVRPGQCSAP